MWPSQCPKPTRAQAGNLKHSRELCCPVLGLLAHSIRDPSHRFSSLTRACSRHCNRVTLADHRQSVMASLLSPRPWTLERTHGWQWDWQSATLASEYWPQGHGNETLRLPISKFEECNRRNFLVRFSHNLIFLVTPSVHKRM